MKSITGTNPFASTLRGVYTFSVKQSSETVAGQASVYVSMWMVLVSCGWRRAIGAEKKRKWNFKWWCVPRRTCWEVTDLRAPSSERGGVQDRRSPRAVGFRGLPPQIASGRGSIRNTLGGSNKAESQLQIEASKKNKTTEGRRRNTRRNPRRNDC